MNTNRWQYLKSLRPDAGRLVHLSANAWMQRHPLDIGMIQTMPLIPMVQKPGKTFCENRSARKRANRENSARELAK